MRNKQMYVATVILLAGMSQAAAANMFAQSASGAQSSDLSSSESTLPGMQKTTSSRGSRPGGGGAASAITPAATGRLYPASGELLIGVGDLLHVAVFDTPEFDQDARVDPEGHVDFNGIGSLAVENMKPADVAAMIQKKLKDDGMVLDPKVTVSIADYISHGVSIQGEIRTPGIYPVLGKRRLADLLTAAGGPTELSDGIADILHPSSPTPDHIDLKSSADTYAIVPGDTITLERAPLVYIVGNVRRAGGFPLARATTISQGLALAQGLSPSAKDKQVYLFRDADNGKRVVSVLNLHKILRGKLADVPLKPNDIVFIPNSSVADVVKATAAALPGIGTAIIYARP
ncbi:MAG: SLBB domain-containing protein [Acidobacteriota bacterium]|nr:SLBB domain-containing protein [Acidobacteriota bacterium]